MSKIETYVVTLPSLTDMLIGTDVNDYNITKNFLIGDIVALANGNVPAQPVNLEYYSYPTFGIITTDTGGTAATIPLVDYSNAGLMSPTDYVKLSDFAVTATAPLTSSGGNTPNISSLMSTNKLIGRSSAGSGVMEEISIGAGLSLSGGTLSNTGGTGGGITKATASGTDTYTTTITGVTGYTDGDTYLIRFTNGNTTGATLNINGLGAKTLYENNNGVLIGGDITNGSEMLCVYNTSLNGFQLIGTSPNALYAYVTNDESTTITKGQVVYAYGGTGDRMTVKLARNTSDATSAQTVGFVMSASIAANQKGLIIIQGLLDGLSILPTATWSDGDPVFLDNTFGNITNVKPVAPNHLVYLGTVTTASNGSAGRIYVRVQNGYELQELHNVLLSTPPNNNDGLFYESSTSLWKNKSIPTVLGYTPEDVANKQNNLTASSTKYPTVDAVNTGLGTKVTANTAITGATKTKITYDSKGLVTAGVDATTADIADSINKRYVTDAQLILLGNLSDGDKGDITVSDSGSTWLIDPSSVTLSKMADIASNSIIGRTSAGLGVPEALTGTQVTSILDNFSTTLKGLAPASGGGTTNFLRADGTWAVPSGGSSYTFSTGLTNTSGTVTSNLSTGIAGGQSVIGGTAASENLTLRSTSNATKGKIIFGVGGTSAYDESLGRLGIGNTSPSNRVQINSDLNIATQSDGNGLFLANSTAAINGTQSGSPPIVLQGNGYATGNSTSQPVKFKISVLPVQGTGSNFPYGTLQIGRSINNGAYANFLEYTDGGLLTCSAMSSSTMFLAQGQLVSANLNPAFFAGSTFNYSTRNSGGTTVTPRIFLGDSTGTSSGAKTYAIDPTYGLVFIGGNASGNRVARASIDLEITSNTANSEDGSIIFRTQTSGLDMATRLTLRSDRLASTTSINSNVQLIQSSSSVSSLAYNTTTGGTSVTPSIIAATNSSTAGDKGLSLDNTNGLVFMQVPSGAQFRRTSYASISGVPTSNTASSEAGDLRFQTQSGGTAMTTKLTIGSTGDFTFFDGGNFILGTTTGTKIATSTSQKLSFWNATPIVQPTTGVTGAAMTANTGTAVNDASTFAGYTIGQVVQALKNIGLLA